MASKNYGLKPPIKEGETRKMEILGHGNSGDPFGKVEGFVIFIKLPKGETIEVGKEAAIKITKIAHSSGFAELQDGQGKN